MLSFAFGDILHLLLGGNWPGPWDALPLWVTHQPQQLPWQALCCRNTPTTLTEEGYVLEQVMQHLI